MYLMYVDESGDTGVLQGTKTPPTQNFVLSAAVIHETVWETLFNSWIDFRRQLKKDFGFLMKEEIHAAPFVSGKLYQLPKSAQSLSKDQRFAILLRALDFQAGLKDYYSVFNVVVDKSRSADAQAVFTIAWTVLIQRLENTIKGNNFKPPRMFDEEKAVVFCDRTNTALLRKLQRKMRVHNPIASNFGGYYNCALDRVIEDPVMRDSQHSAFVQLVDVNAYFLRQWLSPNRYIRRKGKQGSYFRLKPVFCKVVSRANDDAIVYV